MKNFPQLKAQDQIDRDERIEKIKETAWQCVGAVALVAALFAGYILGLQ